ncbi:unnamed protein product, partial [Owenia fusiformis]
GTKCPVELFQTALCYLDSCNHWTVDTWSSCNIENGHCGFGERTRKISCIQRPGLTVAEWKCTEQRPKETERCFLPCPGECHLSTWSSWSHCHVICDPDITEGIQSRSRSILQEGITKYSWCPSNLIETRKCRHTKECIHFIWKTGNWVADIRDVWCESSNGVKVTGGCLEEEQPAGLKVCSPPCNITGSYCQDVNFCTCHEGLESQHSDSGELVNCWNRTMGNNSVKADYLVIPVDGPSNIWMWAVIAAGVAFVVFVVAAVVTICRYMKKDDINQHRTTFRLEREEVFSVTDTETLTVNKVSKFKTRATRSIPKVTKCSFQRYHKPHHIENL